MASNWVSVYTRCSQYKLTGKKNEGQPHPGEYIWPCCASANDEDMLFFFFFFFFSPFAAADGRSRRKSMCDRVSCWWLNSCKRSRWRGANSLAVSLLFMLAIPCVNANMCVFVCVFVHWREVYHLCEWLVEQKKKTCLSRSSILSMDLTVARHDLKKNNKKTKKTKGLLTGAWHV